MARHGQVRRGGSRQGGATPEGVAPPYYPSTSRQARRVVPRGDTPSCTVPETFLFETVAGDVGFRDAGEADCPQNAPRPRLGGRGARLRTLGTRPTSPRSKRGAASVAPRCRSGVGAPLPAQAGAAGPRPAGLVIVHHADLDRALVVAAGGRRARSRSGPADHRGGPVHAAGAVGCGDGRSASTDPPRSQARQMVRLPLAGVKALLRGH